MVWQCRLVMFVSADQGMSIGKPWAGQSKALHVVVATPLGEGGHGGIDRIVDEIRHQLAAMPPDDLEVAFVTTRGSRHILFSPFYFAVALCTLAALRLAGRADLLHVNLSSHGSTVRKALLCYVARLLNIPYVLHLHGSRFRGFYHGAGRVFRREIMAMFGGASRIVVLGDVWQTFVTELSPSLSDRIDILPNATRSPPCVAKREEHPVSVLFLGKVGKRKGVPQLVEAFDQLATVPGWVGIIAGDGEVEPTRADIERRGISSRVTLTGWIDPAQVDALLAKADILVLPSFDENLPMSVIEGMGHGLAVVATPVGAVTDIIQHDVTGLLVPAGDSEGLAHAIGLLIGDPALRRRLGAKARAFHRDHLNIDAYLPRLLAIWQAAAAERQTGSVGATL